MALNNWTPWWVRPEMGAMEWLIEEGFPGWPLPWMWKWIPAEVIAKWETQTEVEAEAKDKPRRKRKGGEPALQQ